MMDFGKSQSVAKAAITPYMGSGTYYPSANYREIGQKKDEGPDFKRLADAAESLVKVFEISVGE